MGGGLAKASCDCTGDAWVTADAGAEPPIIALPIIWCCWLGTAAGRLGADMGIDAEY